jgi:hypothetical protein
MGEIINRTVGELEGRLRHLDPAYSSYTHFSFYHSREVTLSVCI